MPTSTATVKSAKTVSPNVAATDRAVSPALGNPTAYYTRDVVPTNNQRQTPVANDLRCGRTGRIPTDEQHYRVNDLAGLLSLPTSMVYGDGNYHRSPYLLGPFTRAPDDSVQLGPCWRIAVETLHLVRDRHAARFRMTMHFLECAEKLSEVLDRVAPSAVCDLRAFTPTTHPKQADSTVPLTPLSTAEFFKA
jgi:hypothetical protein